MHLPASLPSNQGLGNAFLSNISACDALFHVCRAFADDEITHVEGDVDPVRDLGIISSELRLKDLATVIKCIEPIERSALKSGDKKKKAEYDMLCKFRTHLEAGLDIRQGEWDAHEVELLNSILFLTAKPVIFLVNLSERDYIRKKNKWLAKIKAWVDEHEHNGMIIPYSADFEYSLALLPDDEARAKRCEEAGAPSYVLHACKHGSGLTGLWLQDAAQDHHGRLQGAQPVLLLHCWKGQPAPASPNVTWLSML